MAYHRIKDVICMAGKRGQGEGCIYKRNDGTWAAVITTGRDENGHQKRQFIYGKTRTEVAEKLLKTQNDMKTGTYIKPTKATVGEWLDTWLEQYKRNNLRPTTYSSYEQHIRVHIKPSIGHILLSDLTPEMVQKFYNDKFKAGRYDGEGGLSSATVRKIHNILHDALNQAVLNNLVHRNSTEATKRPKLQQKEIKIFTVEEQKLFMNSLKDEDLGAAFLMDLSTGIRLGELLALKWKNVDLEQGIVWVRESVTRVRTHDPEDVKTKLITQAPKTKSGYREIPLPTVIIELLKKHKGKQESKNHDLGTQYEDKGLVFCTENGNYIEPRNFMRKFYHLLYNAGLTRTNVHSLRHTFATRLFEANESAKTVQELMGHSDISHTLNIYTHVMPEVKRSAVQKLNRMFEDFKI